MAQLRDAIIQSVINDPTLSAKLLDGSIYHIYDLKAPDGTLSASPEYIITFGQVSSIKNVYIDLEKPLIQFSCIAKTLGNAIDLKNDLLAVFERFKGNLGNKRDVKFVNSINENHFQDPDSKLYIVSIDFRFKTFGNNL